MAVSNKAKHLITAGFLLAAIGLYMVGMALAATTIVVIGMLLEGVFWLRLFRARKEKE